MTNRINGVFFAVVISCLVLAIGGPASAQTWLQLEPTPDPQYGSPAPRNAHTAVYNSATNRMIIFGGSTGIGGYGIVNDVWVLTNADGTAGTPAWIRLTPTEGASPRTLSLAVYDQATNRMIVQGGHTLPGYCEGVVGDAWVLTNADGTGGTPEWQTLPAGPAQRAASAAYDAINNRLIVWGGMPTACGYQIDRIWILTNANGLGGAGQWSQLFPANPVTNPYFGNGPAGYDPNTSTLTGLAWNGTNVPENWFNSTRLLSGANGVGAAPAWSDLTFTGVIPHLASAKGVHDVGRNKMLIACGYDYLAGQLNCASWRLDHANGQGGTPSWTALNPGGNLPPGRFGHSVVLNPESNRLIMFGGTTGGSVETLYNDVWVLTDAMGAPEILNITIDIKPGSFPNSVNPRSRGVIPVAILTTSTFDASTVNPASVRFGKNGTEAAPVHHALLDVNGDGRLDLLLHFGTQSTGIECGNTSARLTGETMDGQKFAGQDSIKTSGCNSK